MDPSSPVDDHGVSLELLPDGLPNISVVYQHGATPSNNINMEMSNASAFASANTVVSEYSQQQIDYSPRETEQEAYDDEFGLSLVLEHHYGPSLTPEARAHLVHTLRTWNEALQTSIAHGEGKHAHLHAKMQAIVSQYHKDMDKEMAAIQNLRNIVEAIDLIMSMLEE